MHLDKSKERELRNFGLFFTLVFALVGFVAVSSSSWKFGSFAISAILFTCTTIKPTALTIPYKLWLSITKRVSQILTPIELAFLYFTILTPFSIVYRISRQRKEHFESYANADSTWRDNFPEINKEFFRRSY
jgi:hypothetical protein